MNQSDLELLEKYLDGNLTENDFDRLRSLLSESKTARAKFRTLATVDIGLQDIAAGTLDHELEGVTTSTSPGAVSINQTPDSGLPGFVKSLLAVAAAAVVLLGGALWLQKANYEKKLNALNSDPVVDKHQHIAEISAMAGTISWTGNDGLIATDLKVGSELTGGTIEGASPNAWATLRFLDGSTVTVAGDSRLTFSDFGQKVLHLRQGKIASRVEPQPEQNPMLVYTRTALMEVLGTEFNVESEVDTTSLNVTEGKVRLKRLVDGLSVDVPANNRVVASSGSDLQPKQIPDSTSQWTSQLARSPDRVFGKWNPKTETTPATLKLVPHLHTNVEGKQIPLYVCGVHVSHGKSDLIVLKEDSRIRVKGRVKRVGPDLPVFLGVAVRTRDGRHLGSFLDHFQHIEPATDKDGNFEVTLEAAKLWPESKGGALNDWDKSNPVNSIVEYFFCSTPTDWAGLEITEVEIFRETEN